MAQDVTIPDEQALRQEIAQAVKTMQESGHPEGAKAADLFKRMANGDASALPPEARASMERMQALYEQGNAINNAELLPAQENLRKAGTTAITAMAVGAVAAGVISGYLSGGMSWIPFLSLTMAGAAGGVMAGRAVTSSRLTQAQENYNKAAEKLATIAASLEQEKELFDSSARQYAEALANGGISLTPPPGPDLSFARVNSVEMVGTGPAMQTQNAARLAALKPAGSHAAAVDTSSSPACGCGL